MTVTVFGLGFVGLTTALGLASKGHQVYGFDVDTARRETIASGHLPFLEPGLDDALQQELGQDVYKRQPTTVIAIDFGRAWLFS